MSRGNLLAAICGGLTLACGTETEAQTERLSLMRAIIRLLVDLVRVSRL